MATQNIRQLRWYSSEDGSPAPQIQSNCLEANSMSFVEGDLVYLNAGVVTEYTADGLVIAGIACKAATNVTTGNIEIPFIRIRPCDVFIANLNAVATAVTQRGVVYGLTSPSAGKWAVDTTDTSHPRVVVLDIVEGADTDSSGNPIVKAVGDTSGEVIIKFLVAAADHDAAAHITTANIIQLG